MEFMNFSKKTLELLDRFDGFVTFNGIIESKELIHEIAVAAKETELFKKGINHYTEFLDHVLSFKDENIRVMSCMSHLIKKIALAPDRSTLNAVAIMLMPALDEAINSINHQTETTCQQQQL